MLLLSSTRVVTGRSRPSLGGNNIGGLGEHTVSVHVAADREQPIDPSKE